MPKHQDFIKIHNRFVKQYGSSNGDSFYNSWISERGYDEIKEFPKSKNTENKEMFCSVIGVEIKETDLAYHVEGLIATDHIDNVDLEDGVDIPDVIPKGTLEAMAARGNSDFRARVMGLHHSEGHPISPEYYGVADVEETPR